MIDDAKKELEGKTERFFLQAQTVEKLNGSSK